MFQVKIFGQTLPNFKEATARMQLHFVAHSDSDFLSAISVVRFCLFSEQRIRRCTKFDLMINTKLTFLVKPSFQKMAINNIWLKLCEKCCHTRASRP